MRQAHDNVCSARAGAVDGKSISPARCGSRTSWPAVTRAVCLKRGSEMGRERWRCRVLCWGGVVVV